MKTKLISILMISAIVLAIAVLVVAQTQQELEAELAQLESELVSEGYGWLRSYSGIVDNIFVANYTCNETGYETSQVLTEGVHNLEFDFGGFKAYANNYAFNETNCTHWDNGVYYQSACDGNVSLNLSKSNEGGTELLNSQEDGFYNMTGNVFLLHLDDNNMTDTSGNNHAGTQQGGIDCGVIGKIDDACEFDGSGDGIYYSGSSINNLAVGTFMLWIKPNSFTPANANVVLKLQAGVDTNFYTRVASDGHLYFGKEGDGANFVDNNLSTGIWSHVAIVWNGTHALQYIDGQFKQSDTFVGGIKNDAARTVSFGKGYNEQGGNDFNGSLDEIAVWNRVLSANEILKIYDNQVVYPSTGNYTSQTFDAGSLANWSSIEWGADMDDGGQAVNGSDVLLLSMDGDDSASNHKYTFYGNPKLNASAHSNVSNSSMFFDGTGDNLTIPDSSDWDLTENTEDYTIDFWVKQNTVTNMGYVKQDAGAPGNRWYIANFPANYLAFEMQTGGTTQIWLAGTPIADTNWHHVALVKESTKYTFYLDGSSAGTVTDSSTATFAAGLTIGHSLYTSDLNGSIDEFRISKGTARWTASFTPDTSPYEPDTNTTLLLHFDGDESGSGHNLTFNGDMDANATDYRFDGSYYFDGTGDYLSIPDSSDWDFGSGDFTIDFWMNIPDTSTSIAAMSQYTNNTHRWSIFLGGSAYGLFFRQGDDPNPNAFWVGGGSNLFENNNWHHVAVVRNFPNFYGFVDGVQVFNRSSDGLDANSMPMEDYPVSLNIGEFSSTYFTGHLDELRISKGIARWTSNFDVPVRPYPYNVTHLEMQTRTSNDNSSWTDFAPVGGKDDYNVLLIDSEEADGFRTNGTIDNTTRHRLTFNGNANFSTNQAKFGSASMGFDGTGDYISIPDSSDWDFGSGDFTIDMWYRASGSEDTTDVLYGQFTANPYILWDWGTSGKLRFISYSGAADVASYDITNAQTWTAGTWYHIALVRSGTNIYMFKDGISQDLTVSTAISTNALPNVGVVATIGGRPGGTAAITGYIDELRITKGLARWTENFTVPTGAYSSPLTSPSDILNTSSRYLQYKANFLTESTSYTPFLEWVNLSYFSAGNVVTLNTPTDNNNSVNFSNVVFNCSGSDVEGLVNASLYSNYTGTWGLVATNEFTGASNSTTFTRDLFSDTNGNISFFDDSFAWNCLIYNSSNMGTWGASNYTFSSWDLGTYYQTKTDGENVTLSGTNATGNYTSQTFDAGSLANWTGVSWGETQINGTEDNNTKLLLHADGADGGTTFIDSAQGRAVTANGEVNTSTNQFKFGNASGGFDGTGDYLSLATNADFYFASGAFTFDFWVRLVDTNDVGAIFNYGTDTNNDWLISESKNQISFQQRSGAVTDVQLVASWSPQNNTWYHVALVRINNSNFAEAWRIFVDGESKTLTKNAGNWNLALGNFGGGLYVGARATEPADYFNGYLDEVRITKGTARWTSNFTVPTIPYPLNATKLNLQTRTSNDAASWTAWSANQTNPSGLLNSSARYLQYRAELSTDDTSYTPFLEWVNVSYTGSGVTGVPSANRFIIVNTTGMNVASIDDKGDMYLQGTLSQSQGVLSPTANSFIVQNSSAHSVAYFNSTGSLFLAGTISAVSDLSGRTATNMEIRNSTDDLVAFFDNQGNLKLKGGYGENYASP